MRQKGHNSTSSQQKPEAVYSSRAGCYVTAVPVANDTQVGGTHYRDGAAVCPHCGKELQHWDIVAMFKLDYFIGNATKYLFRFERKDGRVALEKSIHYIKKKLELLTGA